ncbi:hypothetical protein NG798_08110 [Ancylothrix sp. C2]|uniref:hypothetical protein n=1 Tax=Ancylothrix sp. D3o TaxID=2953691 RepID=UPI0021BAC420|nr:hypothetical protein [Ancylothrix sp. D3o]MCT7949749.1 hypothetical protein [Ancylothrix sp. D3o]
MKNKHTWLIITTLIFLLLWQQRQPAIAQPGVDSRVSRLESEIASLRGQVSQLQSQVYRLSNRADPGGTAPRVEAPEPQYSPPNYISKSMFDRLATLVIELKERMDTIEQRVRVLEKR